MVIVGMDDGNGWNGGWLEWVMVIAGMDDGNG